MQAFLLGAVLGSAIWILSAVITGRDEPWDSPGFYYPGALLAAGVIAGFICRGYWAVVTLGVFAGQALVLIGRVAGDPGSGGLWPLGLMFMAAYSLLALVGALIGSAAAQG
jgi:hypothetical protein